MRIGNFEFTNPVWLAPMSGITDKPFRMLCRELGAGHAVSEMISSNQKLIGTAKTRGRMQHDGETGPIHVQIAGSDPTEMAQAARFNVAHGADIIDINMGCPAKKVCSKLAGSSLLRDEALVQQILEAVVDAVNVPVTLKTRTGWCPDSRNIATIGNIAERAGITCITLHGRTRNDFYNGKAEFDSLRRLRDTVSIPLIANGDIGCIEDAQRILDDSDADAVMIGREAQSQPWLPGQIAHFLCQGKVLMPPAFAQKRDILLRLVKSLHEFYGPVTGPRMARKHIVAQIAGLKPCREVRQQILKAPEPQTQTRLLKALFDDANYSLAA
jgi:tRNA-dihydrouridine synthase B